MADTRIEFVKNNVNGNGIGIQTVDSWRVNEQGAILKTL
jgi:hypothetical protein